MQNQAGKVASRQGQHQLIIGVETVIPGWGLILPVYKVGCWTTEYLRAKPLVHYMLESRREAEPQPFPDLGSTPV